MLDLSEFVDFTDSTLITDSHRVAKHFNKEHHHVVKKIKTLTCSAEFITRNFSRVDFNHNGNIYDAYQITKDGFVMLAMGFTGKEAMKTKEAYIAAFNKMADQLLQIGNSLWQQRLDLETRDATSFMWASFGSKRMLERRRELPKIRTEREQLDYEMQPPLFGQTYKPQELAP